MIYNMRTVEVMQVIKVTTCEGAGTPEDPSRLVSHLFTMDGQLITRIDPWAEKQAGH